MWECLSFWVCLFLSLWLVSYCGCVYCVWWTVEFFCLRDGHDDFVSLPWGPSVSFVTHNVCVLLHSCAMLCEGIPLDLYEQDSSLLTYCQLSWVITRTIHCVYACRRYWAWTLNLHTHTYSAPEITIDKQLLTQVLNILLLSSILFYPDNWAKMFLKGGSDMFKNNSVFLRAADETRRWIIKVHTQRF